MVHSIEETSKYQKQNEQAIPILAIHPKELKAVSQGHICAVILTAALFTTAKIMGKKYVSING